MRTDRAGEKADAFGGFDEGDANDADDEDDEGSPALTAPQRAEWQQAEARHLRNLAGAVAVILALFVTPALLATWNGVYYAFLAERTTGTVVELQGGDTRKRLPSFVAAYEPAKASAQASAQVPAQVPAHPQASAAASAAMSTRLTLQSDGTEAYRRVALGDRVTVLYDPADPTRARLDFFWEVWIWAVIAWGLAAVVALPMALFLRSAARRAKSR